MLQDVLSEVASRFTAVASEMLEQMQKTESSLARLKKARGPEAGSAAGGGGGAAPQLSDIEKMTLQLFLDVQVGIADTIRGRKTLLEYRSDHKSGRILGLVRQL